MHLMYYVSHVGMKINTVIPTELGERRDPFVFLYYAVVFILMDTDVASQVGMTIHT